MAQDEADLIKGESMAKHLSSRRVPQKVGALGSCLDAGTPQRVLDHG